MFKQHINNTSAIENRSQLAIFSPPPHLFNVGTRTPSNTMGPKTGHPQTGSWILICSAVFAVN